ncbi:MAG: TIGR00266 family protein [Myxococcota bacterium]
MQIEIESAPSYGMAIVRLDAGERITAESGSMVAMSKGLTVDTTFNGTGSGGFMDWIQAAITGLVRRFLAGETLFVNHFTAQSDGEQVMLSPALVGDVAHIQLDGTNPITVQSSSYLASSRDVSIDLVWGGFSMLFSGEGAFFLKCKGKGDLLINAYGAIEKVEIDGAYRVDGGHVVAFDGDLTYAVRRAGGLKSTLFSGEGIVLEFKGKGTVWMQTRNLSSLISWISPFLPG